MTRRIISAGRLRADSSRNSAIVVTVDDQKISIGTPSSPWAGAAGEHLAVYMGKPFSGSAQKGQSHFRFAGIINGAGSPPSFPILKDCPFAIVAGQQTVISITYIAADNRQSDPYDQVIVADPT